MFEAILTLCLAADPSICRDVMFPAVDCTTEQAALPGTVAKGALRCEAPGPSLPMEEVAPGVFVHSGHVADAGPVAGGDISNAGFVVGRDAVAVIDTGGSREVGEALYRAIRARTDLPIRYVVLTHMHPDHVFGATVFAEAGAEIIGHPNLSRALADRAETYLTNYGDRLGARFVGSAVPEVATAPSHLDLGERELQLDVWPLAHSGSDLTVFDRETGTLFAGDLVFHRHTPAIDGSLRGWQGALTGIADMDAVQVVPGHGAPALKPDDALAPMTRYLDVLAEDTRAAINSGQSMGAAIETIAQSERPLWELFDLFNPRNATVAFSELEWE